MTQKPFSIISRMKSFQFAFSGLVRLMYTEHNAWLHALATAIVIFLGCWKQVSSTEWVALVIVIGLVWIAELFNTCVEKMMDLLWPQPDDRVRAIKDMAAAAVLIAALVALATGLIIFLPRCW